MKTTVDIVVKGPELPKRLDAYLTGALAGKFSRQEVKRSLEKMPFLLNGKPARPREPVREGDRIQGEVSLEEKWPMIGENIPLKVIYEDDSLFVIDKPAGMVVHPGAGNKKGTLVNALIGRESKLSSLGGVLRPGIVHRLDKDTSGVLLVAKNNASHRALQAQFASRSLSKTYMALVKGRVEFEQGHIDRAIARDPKEHQKMAVSREGTAREAETRYHVLKRFRHATLLEIKLITGRTHQIRVHMRHLGNPVVGDPLYGSAADAKCPRMALHAAKIEFLHPKTNEEMRFESELPKDFKDMILKAENEK